MKANDALFTPRLKKVMGVIPDAFVDETAALLTGMLASADRAERQRGYMKDSGKDIRVHAVLAPYAAQLADLGNRLFAAVPYAKYVHAATKFEKAVIAKTQDTQRLVTPCWRCGEVGATCGCVKCKNNPKYYGSDLGAGTNYEPPTCLAYAASFKVFVHAALRVLLYRYAYPRFELDGTVYKRNDQGVVVVDEEETAKLAPK